jgi:hypothetical protein
MIESTLLVGTDYERKCQLIAEASANLCEWSKRQSDRLANAGAVIAPRPYTAEELERLRGPADRRFA